MKLPNFEPQYSIGIKYGYSKKKGNEKLKELLYKTTNGFCMYCYSRILIDGKKYGQLEHAIEKGNSEKLIECVPNIGISCSHCNLSLKRKGERERKLLDKDIKEVEDNTDCNNNCTVACTELLKLKDKYTGQKSACIIPQPLGVVGKESGFQLEIQYDVLNTEFIPSKNNTYSISEKEFLSAHISCFNLNEPQGKTKQLIEYIREVIDNNRRLSVRESNNMIVDLFFKKMQGKTPNEILKICEVIYKISIVRFH